MKKSFGRLGVRFIPFPPPFFWTIYEYALCGAELLTMVVIDWLVASHHGRGIMTAAVKVFVEWVVANMNVHHIKAHILPENIGSCRVFEKNGFVQVIRSQDELAILETEDGADSKKLDKSLLFEWTRNKN